MAETQSPLGRLFFQVQGQGQPILLLRGLGRSSRYWLGFDQFMAQEFQVVTIDHRGLGKSKQALAWTDSIDHMVEDVIAVLDHLKIDQIHVFGLSLGGMVAMGLAANFPERCLSLMVANSSTSDYSGLRLNPRAIIKILKNSAKEGFHEALFEQVTTPEIVRQRGVELKKQWAQIRQEEGFPLVTIIKQMGCAARFRIKNRIDGSKIPTLILHGSHDQFVPQSNSHRIHSLIPHSKIRAIRDVGHEISIGREEELRSIIRDFTHSAERSTRFKT